MSGDDDELRTTVLKHPTPLIAEALEPRGPRGKLTRLDEPELGGAWEYWLEERTQTVGRDESNAIQLDAAGISRTHGRIYADSGGWMVEDLGSRNGVWINHTRVEQPRRVNDGDVINFGRIAFRLDLVDEQAARPSAEPAAGSGSRRWEELEFDSESIRAGILATIGRASGPETAAAAAGDAPAGGAPEASPQALPEAVREELPAISPAYLRQRLAAHADAIIETLIRRAVEGEPVALRLAVERMWPLPGRPGAAEDGALTQARQVIEGFEEGRLTRDESEAALRALLDADR